MKLLRVLILAFVVIGCTSTQDPVKPPDSVSPLETNLAIEFTAPQFEITMPVPQNPGAVPVTWTSPRTLFAWRPVSITVPPRQARWVLLAASEFGNDFLATLQHLRTTPDDPRWSAWLAYRPGRDEGTSLYSPPLANGRYVFVVQGRSFSGAIDDGFDPARNVRFLEVRDYYSTGPVVRLSGTYVEPFETSGPSPPVRTLIPAGASVQYTWTANASHLGTSIASYRYGWDIADLDDDSLWEIPLTPYDGSCRAGSPRSYPWGTHIFSVEVRDAAGNQTFAEVKIDAQIAESFNGALDIGPGNCRHVLNARSGGRFIAVLAGTPEHDDLRGLDVSTVDVSTLVLEGVAPVSVEVADIVTAGAPNYCGCLDTTPDGRADLVMVFDNQMVFAALDPSPHSNSSRMIWCWGEMDVPGWGHTGFRTACCVDVTGLPEQGPWCPPRGQDPAGAGGGHTVVETE